MNKKILNSINEKKKLCDKNIITEFTIELLNDLVNQLDIKKEEVEETKENISNNIIKICNNLKEDYQNLLIFSREIHKILLCVPPKYNGNKFIYGKMAELSFFNLLIRNSNLESNIKHFGDNEKLNDIHILDIDIKFSIKTQKNVSQIRIMNYYSKSLDENKIINTISMVNMIIINIERLKILIFPLSILPEDMFSEKIDGFDIKSRYFKYICENFPEYVIDIPSCNIKNVNEINVARFIYENYIIT
jgi:hypothetical protein